MRICCTATERWLPTSTGTLASLGPVERVRTTSEPRVAAVPAEGVEWMTAPAATLVECASSTWTPKPAFFSFASAMALASPAVAGTSALPGPALTVNVTAGSEQEKFRKAQLSDALSAGGAAAGSCSRTVFCGASRSTRFTSRIGKPSC